MLQRRRLRGSRRISQSRWPRRSARTGICHSFKESAPGGALRARQAQPPFTAGTQTVAVYATVTNAQGRLVPDLGRDDFTVDDEGKRQELTLFANDIQPITVVMLLDRSGSMVPNFALEE